MKKLLFFLYILIINYNKIYSKNEKQHEYEINNQNLKNQCFLALANINNLPYETEEAYKKSQEKLKTGDKNIIKHEIEFYSHMIPLAERIKDQIKLSDIQESEYNNTIVIHLNNILSLFKWTDEITQANNWYAVRDYTSLTNRKITTLNIEKELALIEVHLEKERFIKKFENTLQKELLPEIQIKLIKTLNEFTEKIINPKEIKLHNTLENLEKNLNEKETKIYNEINTIKDFITEKEENFKITIKRSINSLSRVSLCVIAGLFAHSIYNRFMNTYNQKTENNKIKKSNSAFFKKNFINIIDSCLFFAAIFYIFTTPSHLKEIWKNKD